jgi:hypothetical protein
MWRSSFGTAAFLGVVSGCTMLAGLDGDYTLAGSTGAGGSSAPSSVVTGGGPVASSVAAGGTSGSGGSSSAGGGGGAMVVPEVACYDNGTLCAPGEVCCVTINARNNTQIGCAQPGLCTFASGFEASCDGPEDCAQGSTCCGTHPADLYWTSIQCDPACNMTDQYVMCGGANPGPQYCGGGTCYQSTDMAGYAYCNYP